MYIILYKETSKVNNYAVDVIIGKHGDEDYFGRAYIYNANDDAKRNLLYYASYWQSSLSQGFAVFEGGFIETNLYPLEIHQIVDPVYQLFQSVANKEVNLV